MVYHEKEKKLPDYLIKDAKILRNKQQDIPPRSIQSQTTFIILLAKLLSDLAGFSDFCEVAITNVSQQLDLNNSSDNSWIRQFVINFKSHLNC